MLSFSLSGVDIRIRTNLDGETSVRGGVTYITGSDYINSQTECEPMGGDDHWERATFWGSDGMLEFFNVVSNMKRRPSSIHRVCGDCGQSRAHCDFKRSNRGQSTRYASTLAVETSREELVQPGGENYNSHVLFRTNFFEYFRVFAPDTKGVGKDRTVRRQTTALPLAKRVHWCPVRLDEIHMRDRN